MPIFKETKKAYGNEMKLADIKQSLDFFLINKGFVLGDHNQPTSDILEPKCGGDLL